MNLQTHDFMRRGFLRSGLVCGLLALLLGLMQADSTVHAQAGATVTISPAVTNVALNNTADVNVLINDYNDNNPPGVNPNGLYGADVRISFSPSIVEVQDSLTPFPSGIQILPGPLLTSGTYSMLLNTADNSAGTIVFVLTQLRPTPSQTCPIPPTPCSGVLFTIKFKGIALGSSPVTITYQELGNANGLKIPATAVNGTVNVTQPTATNVTNFRGEAAQAGQARLDWETGNELDLVGFNVWQSSSLNGEFVKRNAALIPVENPGGLKGNAYHYVDTELAANTAYLYKLEVLKQDGSAEWVGPITVRLPPDCAVKPGKVKLLSPARNAIITGSVTLDWSDVVCAQAYRLQLRRGSPGGDRLQNRLLDASEWTRALASGETYSWRVRAVSGRRHSAWTEWRSFAVK